jgi:hypothetical protein
MSEKSKYPPVTLQQLMDAGLNPFAVQLLAESYAKHDNPVAVSFSYECVRDGKPAKIFVTLSPVEPE